MVEEIIKARIRDTADIALKANKPKFFGFLSEEQAVYAKSILSHIPVKYSLFGGFDFARRVVLCCYPDWCDNISFPISAVTLSYKKDYKLTHRDFLGSLMGLGIKRETVGDILCEDGRAVVFCVNEILPYIKEQLFKVGNVGVEVTDGFSLPLPIGSALQEFTVNVASERLDCIVSALISSSRSSAEEKISLGYVSVNSVTTEKVTKAINQGDIITVRGFGKYIIEDFCNKTKKNRLVLKYKKYV